MKQVNTKDGRTIWVEPSFICTADYDKDDQTAILSLISGEVIRTTEYAPELLYELGVLSDKEAEALEEQLTKEAGAGTETGQK